MNLPLNPTADVFDAPVLSVAERNRVLRNTYWLLALSMLPLALWVAHVDRTRPLQNRFANFDYWIDEWNYLHGSNSRCKCHR